MPYRRIVLLLCIIAACAFAGWLAYDEANLNLVLESLRESGPLGFYVFSILYNVLVIPFPYDPFLAATPFLYPHFALASLVAAMLSTVAAAFIDYALGFNLTEPAQRWFKDHKKYAIVMEKLHKYGWGAVALSAVTPLPFSLVCWACGIARSAFWPFIITVFITRGIRNFIVWVIVWEFLA